MGCVLLMDRKDISGPLPFELVRCEYDMPEEMNSETCCNMHLLETRAAAAAATMESLQKQQTLKDIGSCHLSNHKLQELHRSVEEYKKEVHKGEEDLNLHLECINPLLIMGCHNALNTVPPLIGKEYGYHHNYPPPVNITHDADKKDPLKIKTEVTDDLKSDNNKKILNIGNKPFVCDTCNKSFNQKSNLKSHQLTHTGYKPYVCPMCNRAFSQRSHLKSHQLVHTGDKPFVCEYCNRCFSQRSNLKSHLLTHTGSKPFLCGVCNRSFTQRSNLKSHQLIHTGDKPFVCDFCNKSFSQRSNLKTHRLLHTGLKPFVCQFCKKSFNEGSNLKKHQLLHTGDKPYMCEVCNKSFNQKSNLNKHKIIHSGNELDI